jgi:hypothetical protein
MGGRAGGLAKALNRVHHVMARVEVPLGRTTVTHPVGCPSEDEVSRVELNNRGA